MPSIVNAKIPIRRWSRPYVITLSDAITDYNLLLKGTPYKYVQNIGTGGLVAVCWTPNDAVVNIYLGTGQVMEGGLWTHAKTTGTGAGVSLIGMPGMEGR